MIIAAAFQMVSAYLGDFGGVNNLFKYLEHHKYPHIFYISLIYIPIQ